LRQGNSARAFLGNAALLVVAILFSLIVCEIAFRLVDGYRLDSLALTLQRPLVAKTDIDATPYAKQLAIDPDFNLAWFPTDPPDYDRRPKNRLPNDWLKAETDYKPAPGERAFVRNELMFLYNYNWLVDACKTGAHTNVISHYKRFPGFVYAFASPDSSDQPAYRMAPSAWDYGTNYYNNFGFRGRDITPRKGPRVVRIALLGSSASANGWPFTFPDYIVHFLQLWANAEHANVRFDLVNGSRGGIDSMVLDKVMRYEVAPLHPDIVVYYEGGNDLHARDVLPREATASKSDVRTNLQLKYLPLEQYSALTDRIYELLFRRGNPEGEPLKPAHTLTADLTKPPDLTRDDLPFDLHRQISDLRQMHSDATRIGAMFFLTSFVTLAREGLLLDPERQRVIFQELNDEYWPLTYREIREAVDYQNNAYRELAQTDGLPFLDVSRYFPQNPDFFADMVHFDSQSGFRLQGWILAQLLAPYIKDAIDHGKLPKPGYTPDKKSIAWATAPPIKFNLSCLPQ
jgi:hypothetical protein